MDEPYFPCSDELCTVCPHMYIFTNMQARHIFQTKSLQLAQQSGLALETTSSLVFMTKLGGQRTS